MINKASQTYCKYAVNNFSVLYNTSKDLFHGWFRVCWGVFSVKRCAILHTFSFCVHVAHHWVDSCQGNILQAATMFNIALLLTLRGYYAKWYKQDQGSGKTQCGHAKENTKLTRDFPGKSEAGLSPCKLEGKIWFIALCFSFQQTMSSTR